MALPHADERELITADISAYLKKQTSKELLRFITCGSVDDGKSTLIGRLLYETRQIFDDQMAALEAPKDPTSISRCWSTASLPSASRASPSTSPTAFSPRRNASSSSPTRQAMNNIPATW
jgi:hypothetical protein